MTVARIRPELLKLITKMLRSQRRGVSEALAIVARLEAVAYASSSRPGQHTDLEEVAGKARVLLSALESRGRTLGDLLIASPDEWQATRTVLGRIARLRSLGRPRARRRYFLRAAVLRVLRDEELPWRRSETAAAVMAVVEDFALGDAPSGTGKLAALRRTVRRIRASKS